MFFFLSKKILPNGLAIRKKYSKSATTSESPFRELPRMPESSASTCENKTPRAELSMGSTFLLLHSLRKLRKNTEGKHIFREGDLLELVYSLQVLMTKNNPEFSSSVPTVSVLNMKPGQLEPRVKVQRHTWKINRVI